jgi:chromosome segregation ATPase
MKPHPLSPPPQPADAAADPEITAELPVIDTADCEPDARTDPRSAPATDYATRPADAEASQRLEAGSQAVSAKVREIQERLASKNERLRQLESARDEEHASRVAAEQRSAQLDEELAQAVSLASSVSARATQLEQAHAAQQRASLEQHARELEAQQALAAGERAHRERITAELQAERARSASYFEALQTAEGRRAISEELWVDLQHAAQARAAELAAVGRELVGQHAQVRELEAELAQRAGRITGLEQQVSSFTAGLAQRDTQLHEALQESQGLRQELTRLQAELTASTERERGSAALAEHQQGAAARQQGELERLGAERAGLQGALESARAAALASTTQLAALQAALVGARERTALLEAALATGHERIGQLERDLETVRGEMEDWGQALRIAQQERDGHLAAIAAGAARAGQLEQQAIEQAAAMRALRAQADGAAARVCELEEGLRASEEAVKRVESEARSGKARIAELEQATQAWRAALDELRLNSTDSRARPILHDVVPGGGDDTPAPHAEAVPDGAVRLLIQTAGGREIVHVLGRRTSIGRTPDNDLQIEAKCVSRRHAVILTGPLQTVIEDLNSTNGVLVNGQRISRQSLKDGDRVVIGQSGYRFAVHQASNKR